MWGGRFEKEPDPQAQAFSHSLFIDQRLWSQDIQGSIAHARMLGITGIISQHEANTIVQALLEIAHEIQEGESEFDWDAEDIHTAVERRLYAKIGTLAGKLHTGRSRNDQVATDTRLWLREMTPKLGYTLADLCRTLIELAEEHTMTLLPGLTHQQHAQPVSLAHHLMAHMWAFGRDLERLVQSAHRMNLCPLGSGALAGTSFPIDRELTANELGFSLPTPNSMDAVSDRDFVADYLYTFTMIMLHLSRIAQELINWSTPEYGFVELDDAYTTGSSLMPQKKNPDIAELIRGRSALAVGNLTAWLTLLKGLPLTYNRDLQDDKPLLFATFDYLMPAIRLMNEMLKTAKWNTARMRQALVGDFSTATELADYLVRKGMPFREAHHVVGQIVRECLQQGIGLESLTLEQLRRHSPLFEEDALQVVQPEYAVQAKQVIGGTAPEAVQAQVEHAKKVLELLQNQLHELANPV